MCVSEIFIAYGYQMLADFTCSYPHNKNAKQVFETKNSRVESKPHNGTA